MRNFLHCILKSWNPPIWVTQSGEEIEKRNKSNETLICTLCLIFCFSTQPTWLDNRAVRASVRPQHDQVSSTLKLAVRPRNIKKRGAAARVDAASNHTNRCHPVERYETSRCDFGAGGAGLRGGGHRWRASSHPGAGQTQGQGPQDVLRQGHFRLSRHSLRQAPSEGTQI